jgi:3D (Asp-Asp-Asp) domain-containing protein
MKFLSFPFVGLCLALSSCTSVEQKSSASSFFGKSASSHINVGHRNKSNQSRGRRRTVRTTAYSHLENEPGAYGRKNAIGTNLRYGTIRSAAADWSRYPLGTQFRIEGQPHIYEVDDFGSALVGTDTLDLYKPTLGAMNSWGVRHVDIHIVKWGSYERSAAILANRTSHSHVRKMYRDIQPKVKSRHSTNPDSLFSGLFQKSEDAG